MKATENSLPKSNILRIPYKPSRYKIIQVLFFRKVCQLIALTSVELDGIISGFSCEKSRPHRQANTGG